MIDYAKPLIDAEMALKEVYELAIHGQMDKASDRVLDVVEHVLHARAVILGIASDRKTAVCS